jgi:hypothetical protein
MIDLEHLWDVRHSWKFSCNVRLQTKHIKRPVSGGVWILTILKVIYNMYVEYVCEVCATSGSKKITGKGNSKNSN